MDLSAINKEKYYVNNHAIIRILFVDANWTNVKFKKRDESGDGVKDEAIINTCDKWIYSDTINKGGGLSCHTQLMFEMPY